MTKFNEVEMKNWEKKNQMYEERSIKLETDIKAAIEASKTGILKIHNDESFKVTEDLAI